MKDEARIALNRRIAELEAEVERLRKTMLARELTQRMVADAEAERLREENKNLREALAATEALKGIDIGPLNRAMVAAAETFEDSELARQLRDERNTLLLESASDTAELERLREENKTLKHRVAFLDESLPTHPSWPTCQRQISELTARLRRIEEAAEPAKDLLRRLSEWDMFWVDPKTGQASVADGRYWQDEIQKVLPALRAALEEKP